MAGEDRRGVEPFVRRRPRSGWSPIDFPELWRHRELLLFQVQRDIKVRYKQTLLGVGWAVLQPLLTMVVFAVFFGRLAGIPSEGLPYPIYAFCALLPWQLFASGLTQASNSLIEREDQLTKVYFPRIILPSSAVLTGLVDFAVAFVVLLALMAWYGVVPGWSALTLPLFTVLAAAAALAVGLWLSAFNVRFRDVRYTIPFLAQLWLLATPVGYPSSLVPEAWRPFYALNPMVGVVDGFRWALIGSAPPPMLPLAVSIAVTLLLLVSGAYVFRRLERTFADVV